QLSSSAAPPVTPDHASVPIEVDREPPLLANAEARETTPPMGSPESAVLDDDASTAVRGEPKRNAWAWCAATLGALVAALSVWKSLHAPAAPVKLREPRESERRPHVDSANDATTVIPQ